MRGSWPVGELPRLRELLHDDAGSVEYELRGASDALGRYNLGLRVEARLRLTCRRCLEAVGVHLHEDVTLWLARSQGEIDAQPLTAEGPDGIVAAKDLAVRDLVEDQLLLALPYAPWHENCSAQGRTAPVERQTPFAGLRSMLRSRNRH
ncbi:MAG: YceD family protein [Betaproteobacteria bacterium]|nr:YceD family protein [Betaproteobacteria bacterium]